MRDLEQGEADQGQVVEEQLGYFQIISIVEMLFIAAVMRHIFQQSLLPTGHLLGNETNKSNKLESQRERSSSDW